MNIELPPYLIQRDPESHKGDYGHALLIAGSYGTLGAAILAARACLRAGVGLLTIHIPSAAVTILQTAVPEAMLSIDTNPQHFSTLPPHLERYDAIAIGPGLGTHPDTYKAMRQLLSCHESLIIDADGLNLLASNQGELLPCLPAHCILTPHAREFERLYSHSITPPKDLFPTIENRHQACIDFAHKHQCILLHKAHRTLIVNADGSQHINTTGNPGMATAGSGDVLTGILLGLLSQKKAYQKHHPQLFNDNSEFHVAITGAYLHGKSADIAIQKQTSYSLIATDIIENLKYITN